MLEHYFSDDPVPRVKISKWKCARIIFCGQEQTTSGIIIIVTKYYFRSSNI